MDEETYYNIIMMTKVGIVNDRESSPFPHSGKPASHVTTLTMCPPVLMQELGKVKKRGKSHRMPRSH